jgi:hypothetical protein
MFLQVASGLPLRNGNVHAAEVAAVACDILIAAELVKIAERPAEHIRIRSGMHSGNWSDILTFIELFSFFCAFDLKSECVIPVGSCVAGIVGIKTPRYCLYARFSSLQKIHFSKNFHDFLRCVLQGSEIR